MINQDNPIIVFYDENESRAFIHDLSRGAEPCVGMVVMDNDEAVDIKFFQKLHVTDLSAIDRAVRDLSAKLAAKSEKDDIVKAVETDSLADFPIDCDVAILGGGGIGKVVDYAAADDSIIVRLDDGTTLAYHPAQLLPVK